MGMPQSMNGRSGLKAPGDERSGWLFAVDRRYQVRATDIHSPIERSSLADLEVSRLVRRRNVLISVPELPQLLTAEEFLRNTHNFFTPFGLRTLRCLYEIANDEPYWRNATVTIGIAELLDRLHFARDQRGVHYSRNRKRLQGILSTAHLLGCSFLGSEDTDSEPENLESAALITVSEWEHDRWPTRLPQRITVTLNYYEGIKRAGRYNGSSFILLPRVDLARGLPHNRAADLLECYFLGRAHQLGSYTREIRISRGVALEKAAIRTRNVTWASRLLQEALNKLVERGILAGFEPIPRATTDTFACEIGPILLLPQTRLGYRARLEALD